MISRIIRVTVVVSLAAPFAFSQVKYSRPRTSLQSPTPTPTPTPATTMQNQRTIRQRSTPTPMLSKISPTPSGKMASVENQPFIPARKGTVAPTPPGSATLQRTMPPSSKTMSSPQRTTTTQVHPQPTPWPAQALPKPTPTPVPPPDVQAYLDRQLANSKDQKFHITVNGKDLALRPFHVWPQKSTGVNSTSTCVDMRSDEGTIYDIDFVTTGAQVSSLRIHRINGESVR